MILEIYKLTMSPFCEHSLCIVWEGSEWEWQGAIGWGLGGFKNNHQAQYQLTSSVPGELRKVW